MKRRIAYIIDSLSVGGAERTLIQILRHLDREVFEPRVCVLQEKDGNPMAQEIQAMGIPVDWLPVPRLRDLSAIPRLIRYLRETGAQLVHTQLEFSNVIGTLAARLAVLSSISTIHVLPSGSMRSKTRLHNSLEGFVLRTFCNQVIAVSEQARRLFLESTGIRPSKVVTLYNGIDLDAYIALNRSGERLTVRRELSIPETANVVITVAVLRPEKGIQNMIPALPEILERHPETYYLVVGNGSHLENLRLEAGRAGLSSHVCFTGMRRDIPRMLAAADLFVLPTLTEALPTVLMEAMASHLPIVASSVGGVPEMVEEGCNGRLVPPADPKALASACNDLLSDPALCHRMGDLGWEVVSTKFNIQSQVEQLKQIYLAEISKRG